MSKPIIKYVELDHGCTLQTGRDSELIAYFGSRNVRRIRQATQKDVDWVAAMGGRVPEGRVAKQK